MEKEYPLPKGETATYFFREGIYMYALVIKKEIAKMYKWDMVSPCFIDCRLLEIVEKK